MLPQSNLRAGCVFLNDIFWNNIFLPNLHSVNDDCKGKMEKNISEISLETHEI